MFRRIVEPHVPGPGEGELYRIIDLHGCQFPIYYGYYDERDRSNPTVDPMPVYPDFIAQPGYTPEGYRFVTKMQDACPYYIGNPAKEKECAECSHYCHGEDLLGICKCEMQRETK